MSRRTRRGAKRSFTPYIVLGLVLVTAVVAYYIFTQSGVGGGQSSPLDGQPVSSTVLSDLAGVSQSTLTFIGPGTAGTVATSNSTTPLTLNGKPEILYMGAEYCPYCAAERWVLIVALDKFGNFTGLQYTQSSSTDIYPNTYTFSFVNASYTSKYVAFVPVETEDRNQDPLQAPTAAQTDLMSTFDSGQSIPFVDFANKYTLVGAQITPPVLRVGQSATGNPYNWTEIASQLNNDSSVFAQNIDGAANRLITSICAIDGSQPTSVCSNALSTTSYIRTPTSGISQVLVSDAVPTGLPSSPSRLTAWV